jgi:P pilus assembly chaperone PapD
MGSSIFRAVTLIWLGASGLTVAARAELVLSDLVVELQAGKNSRKDIELWNNSDERSYVEIKPAEIINPGQLSETRHEVPNPELLGLLVSPNRMILEPGQHKAIRIADIVASADRERVYRVTVKPVVGDISSGQAGLKILVGYDVLTIVRPDNPSPKVVGRREGRTLIVRNEGNTSAELLNGKQCDPLGRGCAALISKRLYSGAEWKLQLSGDGPIEYSIKFGEQLSTVRF